MPVFAMCAKNIHMQKTSSHFRDQLDTGVCSATRMDKVELRSCEEIGWQAEAPAPPRRKPFRINVGQTLPSVNPAIQANSSQLLSSTLSNHIRSQKW